MNFDKSAQRLSEKAVSETLGQEIAFQFMGLAINICILDMPTKRIVVLHNSLFTQKVVSEKESFLLTLDNFLFHHSSVSFLLFPSPSLHCLFMAFALLKLFYCFKNEIFLSWQHQQISVKHSAGLG